MADEDRRSETFIREVDEELRRDQLKELWSRFGPAFIGVCVLIVLVTAGYRGWIWWHDRQAAQAGDRFLAAVEEIQAGKRAEGEAALQAIAADSGSGYAALARLRLAGEKEGEGAKEDALKEFDALANDKSLAAPLRDMAQIRGALLALDMGDADGAKTRAQPLAVAGNPWQRVALEVLGTAAYQAHDLSAARDMFSQIQDDAQTPPDLRARAQLMIELIDGQLAEPAAPDKASATDGSAPAPEPAAPANANPNP